jgi:hypothetical protein
MTDTSSINSYQKEFLPRSEDYQQQNNKMHTEFSPTSLQPSISFWDEESDDMDYTNFEQSASHSQLLFCSSSLAAIQEADGENMHMSTDYHDDDEEDEEIRQLCEATSNTSTPRAAAAGQQCDAFCKHGHGVHQIQEMPNTPRAVRRIASFWEESSPPPSPRGVADQKGIDPVTALVSKRAQKMTGALTVLQSSHFTVTSAHSVTACSSERILEEKKHVQQWKRRSFCVTPCEGKDEAATLCKTKIHAMLLQKRRSSTTRRVANDTKAQLPRRRQTIHIAVAA